jgi:uncharacterized protein (TIGR02145 family)
MSAIILSFSEPTGSTPLYYEYRYKLVTDIDYGAIGIAYTSPIAIYGLIDNEEYYVQLRSVCGIDTYSDWATSLITICSDNPNVNCTEYGILYNWYTVTDPRGITPYGWSVPTETDIQTLISYTGGQSIGGKKLKEAGTSHWDLGNTGTNDYGFAMVGAGSRGIDGLFSNLKSASTIWSSTSTNAMYAKGFRTYSSSDNVDFSSTFYKNSGFSLRLIKDNSINPGYVADFDGNAYLTVTIGTQVWTSKNLLVRHYNNGDLIDNVVSDIDWSSLNTGGISPYNNDWYYVGCGLMGTPTPTPTNMPTPTPTETIIPPTDTPIPTATPTDTPTATPTDTPTATPSNTPGGPTNTPTATPTDTPIPTEIPPTDTPTPTSTNIPTSTPTNTSIPPTDTPTPTPTNTSIPPTDTPTPTPTDTPTATPTPTPTDIPTATPTDTPTATPTDTPTATPTDTPTPTPPVTVTCYEHAGIYYSASSGPASCSGAGGTQYTDNTVWADSTRIWSSSPCYDDNSNKATDGYYSNGVTWLQVGNGTVIGSGSCS